MNKHDKLSESELADGAPDDIRDDAAIGKAFWISLGAIVGTLCIVGAVLLALSQLKDDAIDYTEDELKGAGKREVSEIEIPELAFKDVSALAGIDFRHVNGASRRTNLPRKLLPETMGGGVAFFDYDNDEDPDLFFVNSDYWNGEKPAEVESPKMALYENDGKGNFLDVTERVGLDKVCFGMGVAVGDYDGDGWRDLYVTAVGKNFLFRNVEGKFEDVTENAGVAGSENDWGTSCGWFDYDNDGLLDLFVCNYITWSPEVDLKLGSTLDGTNRAYAPPRNFAGAYPLLFHNDGDGKFSEKAEFAGLHIRDPNPNQEIPEAKSLGLSFFDFDSDGWTDLFIANDTTRNMLFRNQRDGTFEEMGQACGIAYDRSGNARGAMGIDTARFRSDDSIGVVIGNFANEPVSLFVAQPGSTLFTDEAISTGFGPQTRQELTFGMFFFDSDLDGRLDLFSANGHLEEEIATIRRGQKYKQPPQLFWNAGEDEKTEFVKVPDEQVGDSFKRPMVGRGASYADIDGDGDLDIAIGSCGGKPRLLRNEQKLNHNWLRVRLIGNERNRDALGASIVLKSGDRQQFRYVSPTCSYLSQRELPVTFGLGASGSAESLTIVWPDGNEEVILNPESNQLLVVERK